MRRPDAGNDRTREVTGASHADKYLLTSAAGGVDISGVFAALCLVPSINSFPFHYAANAAFAAQERWVAHGTRPPSAPPIETVDGIIQRDADGNDRGGLRLPDIDVPIARYEGGTNPNILCALFGSTHPFGRTALRARYGTSASYVAAYRQRAVAARLMTAADRDAAVRAAATVPI
jgi:hypothetical protein